VVPLSSTHPDIEIAIEMPSESRVLYERACWLPGAATDDASIYYLLIFQIKTTADFEPDDVRNFESVDAAFESLNPVSWGLLRGGSDGYVLYENRDAEIGDSQIVRRFDAACRQDPSVHSFLSNAIPLLIHRLKLHWRQQIPELIRANEFPGKQTWKTFMEGGKVEPNKLAEPSAVITLSK
jgi:hypothetical protein